MSENEVSKIIMNELSFTKMFYYILRIHELFFHIIKVHLDAFFIAHWQFLYASLKKTRCHFFLQVLGDFDVVLCTVI